MYRKILSLFSNSYLYKRGDVIVESVTTNSPIYLLEQGYIKESIINPQGDETTIRIISKGFIFPFATMDYTDYIQSMYTVISKEASVRKTSRSIFLKHIFEDQALLMDFCKITFSQINDLKKRLLYLNSKQALIKVAYILCYFAEIFKNPGDDSSSIHIPLGQKEISLFIGTSRETVNAEINILTKMGLVKFENNQLTVTDVKKLAQEFLLEEQPPEKGMSINFGGQE